MDCWSKPASSLPSTCAYAFCNVKSALRRHRKENHLHWQNFLFEVCKGDLTLLRHFLQDFSNSHYEQLLPHHWCWENQEQTNFIWSQFTISNFFFFEQSKLVSNNQQNNTNNHAKQHQDFYVENSMQKNHGTVVHLKTSTINK